MIRYARREQHTSSIYKKRKKKKIEEKKCLEVDIHHCTDLDRILVSANNKHRIYFFCSYFVYIFIIKCKSISEKIKFRCNIGKILTLRHNQSHVCYVRDEVANDCLNTKCRYIYICAHIIHI